MGDELPGKTFSLRISPGGQVEDWPGSGSCLTGVTGTLVSMSINTACVNNSTSSIMTGLEALGIPQAFPHTFHFPLWP